MILKRPHTDELQGEAIGFSLVYSGNFLAQAEVDNQNVTRILMGIHPDTFDWKLSPGADFQTPEAVMVYTSCGLNHLSQTFHKLYQKRLARGYWRDRPRPILINNWEATYFDFTEEKLLDIARRAKDCGVELFVLDDGWFGARRNSFAGLGDWTPNKELLPDGIAGLSAKVAALGMKFGLWFEPEMVNADSDLYRSHPDWLLKTPGVVFAMAMAVKAYTEPGDSVLIQLPVYYPFSEVIQDNGRKVVSSNLYQGEDNRYHIDFQDFEKKIVDNDVKAFILCSPHNPVGRVWRKEELKEMLEICHRHHVYVISDEIHQDFVFGNKKQTPSYLMTEHWNEILTITAPSKTFNLAGGQNSFVIIADENLRAKWDDFAKRIRLMTGNAFGFVAAEAAYKGGQEWLDKVKKQIVDNDQYLRELFKENLPKVVVTPLEATYLVWIDLRAYIKPEDTKEFIQKKCRLAIDFGDWFGGDRFNGFIRMNLATSRENVEIGVKHIIDGILGEK